MPLSNTTNNEVEMLDTWNQPRSDAEISTLVSRLAQRAFIDGNNEFDSEV